MTATVTFDHASWAAIKRMLEEVKKLKAKYPTDYDKRIGYLTRAKSIMELLEQRGGQ
jgi:hypothetical protein